MRGRDEYQFDQLAVFCLQTKNEVPYPGTVLEMLCHKGADTRYVQYAVAQW